MIPIYEQGKGNGIGHGFDSFCDRFDEICREQIATGRARAFAFIFYDFSDDALRRILRNQGVFAKLDRLSGDQLSIFYLHAGSREVIQNFNRTFLTALDIEGPVRLPCVVFFKFDVDQIKDIKVAQLDSADLVHGFHELYSAIEEYLANDASSQKHEHRFLKWFSGATKFIQIEFFRAALRQAFEYLM